MRETLLAAKEIVKVYPGAQKPVLGQVSTEIYQGDFTIIMGLCMWRKPKTGCPPRFPVARPNGRSLREFGKFPLLHYRWRNRAFPYVFLMKIHKT